MGLVLDSGVSSMTSELQNLDQTSILENTTVKAKSYQSRQQMDNCMWRMLGLFCLLFGGYITNLQANLLVYHIRYMVAEANIGINTNNTISVFDMQSERVEVVSVVIWDC